MMDVGCNVASCGIDGTQTLSLAAPRLASRSSQTSLTGLNGVSLSSTASMELQAVNGGG